MKLDDVAKLIEKAHNILLLTHEKPDGDALGSVLGFTLSLEKKGKNVSCFCADAVPGLFSFLPAYQKIKKDLLLGDHDLIIILDCGDSKRTGIPQRIKDFALYKNKIVNIDHHPKNDLHRIAKYNFVDYQSSSTAEIIYNLIKLMKINIDKDIALCLLCGLYTDTASFKHSCTTPKTLQIASELLRRGARLKKITQNVIANHSVASLKLWGIALSRLQINSQYHIAISIITQKDIASCQATEEDVSGIVNMINTVPQVKIALFLFQKNTHEIKGSLRTEDDNINLSRMASFFGGGGHRKASGFTINGKIFLKDNKFEVKFG